MKTLEQIQIEHKAWVERNFGDYDQIDPLFGLVEEVGELFHGILKRRQNIRGSSEIHDTEIKDAIGDIAIYLMDVARCQGYELSEAMSDTWEDVRKRDWKKYPTDGMMK